MAKLIYKIVTPSQWDEALNDNVFKGAPIDLADGYIHFSTREQVVETAEKHFRGTGRLLLLAFDCVCFGDTLKWEPSRGGALFPHLYTDLDPALCVAKHELLEREDGTHIFPDGF